MLRVLMFLLPLVLAVYALIDCIQTPDEKVRHIPKLGWIVLIVLIGVVGPIAWLIAGRERGPGRALRRPAPPQPIAPDDDPDFLSRLADEARRNRREEGEGDPGSGGSDRPRPGR